MSYCSRPLASLAPLDVGAARGLPEAGPHLEEAEAVPGRAQDPRLAPAPVLGVQQVPAEAGLRGHPLQEHHVSLQFAHHLHLQRLLQNKYFTKYDLP